MSIDAVAFFEKITCNASEEVATALALDPTLAHARDGTLGSTPLHFAAHRGFAQIVEALLAAGADVHAREAASDTTPLHWAAEGGHAAIARRLMEQGAELEALDSWYGLAPLGWATIVRWAPQFHDDKPTTAVTLIQSGAAIDIFSALAGERDDVVRALVSADPGQVRRRLGFMGGGMEPLHFAVSQGQLEMARLLLDLGAVLTARTVWGLTPLALAYRSDDAQLDELLRERGAVADVSTALIGQDAHALKRCLAATPPALRNALLFTAAQDGLVEGARLLLAAGADANGRTLHLAGEQAAQVSPLHLAASHGQIGVARALLAAGADPSAGAREGIPTPLHLAAGAGERELASLLIEAGAACDAVDATYGATPRQWAEQAEQMDLIPLFPPRAEA